MPESLKVNFDFTKCMRMRCGYVYNIHDIQVLLLKPYIVYICGSPMQKRRVLRDLFRASVCLRLSQRQEYKKGAIFVFAADFFAQGDTMQAMVHTEQRYRPTIE